MLVNRKIRNKRSERGVALILSLLVLLVVTALAAGMLIMSNSETQISSNFRDEQIAFFAARAGVEEARDRMRADAVDSINASLPTALPGTPNGILYVTNPNGGEVVQPWNTKGKGHPDLQLCAELGPPSCNSDKTLKAQGWYRSAAASKKYASAGTQGPLPWKWARVNVKINTPAPGQTISSVDGSTNGSRVCWNGRNEITTTAADCGDNSPVYEVSALARTPSGSSRMIQYEEVLNINIPIVAALYAKNSIDIGQALNITGQSEPICNKPSTAGAISDTSTVTTPGGGNVTGTPPTINNYQHALDVQSLVSNLLHLPTAPTDITTVTGITSSSASPPSYTLTAGNLGTAPTVNPTSGAISTISNPGSPQTYATPDMTGGSTIPASMGNLTLGGGPGGVNGQGVLIVQGNLTIDVTNGFNYYGLIVATGDIIFTAADNAAVNPQIHGAMITGGGFKTCSRGNGCKSSISNMSGSISTYQNKCFVDSALGPQFFRTIATRELMY